jgi:murein DD-endopeptidase MepM/ murein hydrolase activator NlpD
MISPAQGPVLDTEHGMGMVFPEFPEPVSSDGDGVSVELASLAIGAPEPLEYSKPQMLLLSAYKIQPGDTISELAVNFGLDQGTLISLNSIRYPRALQIGQILRIPNQDGILYKVKAEDTLASIAEKHKVQAPAIQMVNELFSERINTGTSLFIPGAKMDNWELQEIIGTVFIWPTRGYITSSYGYRSNPFGGGPRQFHTGLDIGAPTGTPIAAAMSGRVITVGYNETNGNYVVISHHSGYRTLYAHMSVIRVKSGAYVSTGARIGDVGNTGLSTGPHLHFTVYKNGVTVNPRTLMN